MSGACGTYRSEEKCIQGFAGGKLNVRDCLKDLGVNGRKIMMIIIKWMLKNKMVIHELDLSASGQG
jgi:hypothetical protein